jgi:hypothetical protein
MQPHVVCGSLEDSLEVVRWIKSEGGHNRQGMRVGHGVFSTFHTYYCRDK